MVTWKTIGMSILYGLPVVALAVVATIGFVNGCGSNSSSRENVRVERRVEGQPIYKKEETPDEKKEEARDEAHANGLDLVKLLREGYETEFNGHILRYEEHEGRFFREPYNVLKVIVDGDSYELYDNMNAVSILSGFDFRKDKLEKIVERTDWTRYHYSLEIGDHSDYAKKKKGIFEKWGPFYSDARVAIADKLLNEAQLNENNDNVKDKIEEDIKSTDEPNVPNVDVDVFNDFYNNQNF